MQVSVRDVEDEATCGRCLSPWVWGAGWEPGHHFFRPAAGRFAGVAGGGLQLLKITFARSGTQRRGRRCHVRGSRRKRLNWIARASGSFGASSWMTVAGVHSGGRL
jgi:hypothetical protein